LPMTFTLILKEKRIQASLPLPGKVQVINALAAAAIGQALGISAETIAEGLRTFKPAAMRMQVVEREDGVIFINDAYNANPSSMRAAIESFCETYPGRPRWVVLGDMRELGAASREEHEALGRWLKGQPVQKLVLYGRDTRYIAQGAGQGSIPVERYRKKRYLVDALKPRIAAEHPVILFKASRSLKLEDVVSALR
jgi:UDP-N-acetylmuramoyl-tripeptide--D-alanyl-D-alanine ligase